MGPRTLHRPHTGNHHNPVGDGRLAVRHMKKQLKPQGVYNPVRWARYVIVNEEGQIEDQSFATYTEALTFGHTLNIEGLWWVEAEREE